MENEPSILAKTSSETKLVIGILMAALGAITYMYVRHVTSSGCYRDDNGVCHKYWYDSFGRYHERIANPCPPGC